MHIIKLNAIDSTNTYLKRLCTENSIKDYTVVFAENQTSGRGQMGSKWVSQEGKNLTISIFKDVSLLDLDRSFYISMVVSIALTKTLNAFSLRNIQIKWPNDILSEKQKVAGILIENILNNKHLKHCIIGVGLNVNQLKFENLPKATSMRLISGRGYDIEEVLFVFIDELKRQFSKLEQRNFRHIKETYLESLFRMNKPSTFKTNEDFFSGYIIGISDSGRLRVKIEDDIIREFQFKEITLMY